MLLHWKNCILGWLLVVEISTIAYASESNMEITYDNYNDPSRMSDDESRFIEIQNKFLDILGNSSAEMHTVSQLMQLLHTDSGKELGKLFIQGFALGVKQKNSGQALGQFWTRLQGRLSPVLLESMSDYRDFFKGVDISTLPLVWDDLFKKDALGNSLAGLPLGQLVDMLQPTASRYGIDIRALMNSLMGQGDDNLRDLILSVLDNADFSSIMNQIINTTTSAIQTLDYGKSSGQKTQGGAGGHKKGKVEKTLHLFRPLVASLLKENEIDLDADAVLEVLSPLFKSDFLSQASPLISMLTGLGGGGGAGGLGSVLASLMGGGAGGQGSNPQQMAGLLGGLGALLASSGGKNQMDMTSILSMASMFMNKPSKKKANTDKSKNKKKKSMDNDGLDLGALMGLAGQLVGDKIDMNTILDFAAKGLMSGEKEMKKKVPKPPSKKTQTARQGTEAPKVPNKDLKKKQENPTKTSKKSKNLIDIIEPILLTMKTDRKCNAKIKDAIDLGKIMLNKKISTLGGLGQVAPLLISSFLGKDSFTDSGLNVDKLTKSFTQLLAHADWNELLLSLENKDFREMLIRNIVPNMADVLTLLSTEESQNRVYEATVPRIQAFMAAYGLPGVTLDNFPERLAPMLGLLGRGWNLPFNPTTLLVPLKVYLKGLKSWAIGGLQEASTLAPKELERRVQEVLEKDVTEGVLKVLAVTRDTPDPKCLPQRLCEVNSGLQPDSLQAAITRFVSLVAASGPVLETPDSQLLFQTVQAISGTQENCRVAFPGDCRSNQERDEDDEDSLSMDLLYDHQEL